MAVTVSLEHIQKGSLVIPTEEMKCSRKCLIAFGTLTDQWTVWPIVRTIEHFYLENTTKEQFDFL